MREKYDLVNKSKFKGSKRLLLKELVGLSKTEGYAYCSVAYLAAKVGVTERRTQAILRELERDGVVVTKIGAGRKNTNTYSINYNKLQGGASVAEALAEKVT